MTREIKGSEFVSNVNAVRLVEDCIRATKKYTEGIKTVKKPYPDIQGDGSPSHVFYKYYEVYPELDIASSKWDMDVVDFFDWFWGNAPCYDVMFHYDYRSNKASIIIKDGVEAVRKLSDAIPGFGDALKAVNGVRESNKV